LLCPRADLRQARRRLRRGAESDMSETLTQRLLAAVLDEQPIHGDLVRELALSSDAHGELVQLAAVLARLPGDGARAAEARLDGLLDEVSLVAAGASWAPARDASLPSSTEAALSPFLRTAGRDRGRRHTPDPQDLAREHAPASRPSRRGSSLKIKALFLAGPAIAAGIVVVAWARHEARVASSRGSTSAPVARP